MNSFPWQRGGIITQSTLSQNTSGLGLTWIDWGKIPFELHHLQLFFEFVLKMAIKINAINLIEIN